MIYIGRSLGRIKSYREFLEKNDTSKAFNERLKVFKDLYLEYKNSRKERLKILDIGCGKNAVLFEFKRKEDFYTGCDFYKKINIKIDRYKKIDLNEERLNKVFKNEKFDIIFCGEVIEHLFSPDDLLEEIKKLMNKESILILSTPNLAYYVNRVLLLLGISPLFLENSSQNKLGRRVRQLGQMNITEGHIRVFTYRALIDLLNLKKIKIVKIVSVSIWNFWPDKIMSFISKSFAADNIFVLRIDE